MGIRIEITGSSVDEVRAFLAGLHLAMSEGKPGGVQTVVALAPNGKPAAIMEAVQIEAADDEVAGAAEVLMADDEDDLADPLDPAPVEKKKRGRPPKAKAETPAAEPAPAPAPAPAAATDPAKDRDRAIEIMRMVFARGAAGAKRIRELQDKFSCLKFSDVPLDRAAELLAAAEAADREIAA